MQTVTLKRGDTFIPTCTFRNSAGVAADYTALGIALKSQVRAKNGALIAELTVSTGTGTGEFVLESGSTQNWPTGTLYWDIQMTQGSHVFSTVTAALVVSDDITH